MQGWCDLDSTSGENWKEPLTSTISIEASFNGDNNGETLNVNGRKKMGYKMYSNITCPKRCWHGNIGKGFHY